MQIDIYQASCTMNGFATKADEAEDGETKKLECAIKLGFHAQPRFLDDYLAGHNSGAQPSDVFWRMQPSDNTRYVRYFGIDRVILSVPEKGQYRVKFAVAVQKDDPIEVRQKKERWSITLEDCELKHLEVEFMANLVIASAKLRVWPRDQAEVGMLASLAQTDDLVVTIQTVQKDLLSDADETPPPRPGTDTYPSANPPSSIVDAETAAAADPNEAVRAWGDPDDSDLSVE
jgi:hypothetical protein